MRSVHSAGRAVRSLRSLRAKRSSLRRRAPPWKWRPLEKPRDRGRRLRVGRLRFALATWGLPRGRRLGRRRLGGGRVGRGLGGGGRRRRRRGRGGRRGHRGGRSGRRWCGRERGGHGGRRGGRSGRRRARAVVMARGRRGRRDRDELPRSPRVGLAEDRWVLQEQVRVSARLADAGAHRKLAPGAERQRPSADRARLELIRPDKIARAAVTADRWHRTPIARQEARHR